MSSPVESGYLYNINNKASPPKEIGVLIFDGMEPMDFIGPVTIFDAWNELFSHAPKIFTFSKNGVVTCDYGRKFMSDCKLDELSSLDTILVPGGRGRGSVTGDEEMLLKLKGLSDKSKYIMSVCTGTFILNASGIITNERVTTHKNQIENLRKNSDLNIIEGVSCVADGNVWTSAGVFCGSRMALKFVQSFEGYTPKNSPEMIGMHDKIADCLQHNQN